MEELKQRYKMLPIWARLLIAATIGLLPGVYQVFDEMDGLQSQLEEAQKKTETARADFEAARQKKSDMPKLEEKKAFTEEQLLKAKKKLPENFHIEDLLQKVATIAKETGVRFNRFIPKDEVAHRDQYQFMERPIDTEIDGKFAQVASFFDRIVHLEGSVFLRDLDLSAFAGTDDSGATPSSGQQQAENRTQDIKDQRQNIKVKAKFSIVVYRGMSDREAMAGDAMGGPGEVKKKKKGTPAPAAADGDAGAAKPADPKPATTDNAAVTDGNLAAKAPAGNERSL